MRTILSLVLVSILSTQNGFATEVDNIEENIRILGFDRFYTDLKRDKNREVVKIAVFDYGFDGYQEEKGYSIPENTFLKVRPGDTNVRSPDDKNTHGLVMAQIITQYMTDNYNKWSLAPKIYLYKSDGYSNFQWAIEDAIKNGVEIILHSIVIEYGSNYDGRGFFNTLVNRATNAGIVWVNAAGNFGLTTFNSDIVISDSSWVDMDLEQNALPVKCEFPESTKIKKQNRKCNLRLVLAWDDFKNKPQEGSAKDLDLYMFDENFEKSVASELTQVESDDPNQGQSGFTLYPREIIETQIPEGTSYVKVRSKSDNFASTDRLRITAEGDYVKFPVRDKEESLLNPADNPNVITVGEKSSKSSVSKSLNKPELIAPSLVKGDDGKKYKGSSNAAAVVAAGIGLMKKINPDLDREAILELASGGATADDVLKYPAPQRPPVPGGPFVPGYAPPELSHARFNQSNGPTTQEDEEYYERQPRSGSPNPYSIPTQLLQFGSPQGVGCFPLADIKAVEPCIVANFIIKSQSLLVATTAGLKIATSFDPIVFIPGDARLDIRDQIAIFPAEGFAFRRVPRNVPLPRGAIEIFKMPVDEIICKLPDWDFLVTEMEVSRRKLYEANATGAYNNYIPQSCSVGSLAQTHFPVSNWGMYPVLQQSPYSAPVGPSPVEIRSQYRPSQNQGGYGYQPRQRQPGYGSSSSEQNFQLPNPSDVKDE
ncbi:MAG: S8 family serine peptidase [Bdellovibrionota bacterium]